MSRRNLAELRSSFFGLELTEDESKPEDKIMSNSIRLSGLRDDETFNKPNEKPFSGPEIDDLEPADSGIDDGLLPPARKPSLTPSFPVYPPTGFPNNGDPSIFTPAIPRTPPGGRVDVNVYQQKKTLAQGMMDLALLSANANQLRYVLGMRYTHPYFYPSIVLISLSLIFQIAVGIGLIWNSRYNIKKDQDSVKANRVNDFTVLGIFLVTIINVFISAFGVDNANPYAAMTEQVILDSLNSTTPIE